VQKSVTLAEVKAAFAAAKQLQIRSPAFVPWTLSENVLLSHRLPFDAL
jgi:hypothetical protein